MSFFCIVFINIMAFIAVRVRVRVRVRVHGESFLQKCIFIDQYALFNGVFFFCRHYYCSEVSIYC
jgi:hypothetical protein